MGRYVSRRVMQFIPVLFGALFLLHYMTSLGIQLNGDPARAIFGDRRPSEAELNNMRESLGIDDPCLRQTGNPCLGLFVERVYGYMQGDFGSDFRGREITTLLGERAPVTVRLAALNFLFVSVIGIGAGVWAGLRRGRFADYLVKVSTVTVISTPIFILGLVAQWSIGVELGGWIRDQSWLPGTLADMFSPVYRAERPWASLVLPALVLASVSLAFVARLTRTSLIENIRSDYVRTAVAKGMSRRRVVGVHTLRNSMIPVVTLLGINIGDSLAGALITEGIFNIPGIGRQVFQSITLGEGPIVIAIITILVLVYMVMTLLVDILYAVLDPRIRYD